MSVARSYVLEFFWLVILIVLFTLTPARALMAEGRNFEDVAGDCDSGGWCIELEMD